VLQFLVIGALMAGAIHAAARSTTAAESE